MADVPSEGQSPHRPLTQAERQFSEHSAELAALDLPARFAHIHATNLWDDTESVSGSGSALVSTEHLRAELPGFLARLNVRRLLDVPCGDFHWMSCVGLAAEGITYVGGDVVPAIVATNLAKYAAPGRTFAEVDLTKGPLPHVAGAPADAVLCRDCLVHLSFANIFAAFRVLRDSGARYLITTTFLEQRENRDIIDGDWRVLNFERAPFVLPSPVAVLVEHCQEEGGAYADKALAAWRIADLPIV